jgi:hypothetical protein
MIDLSGKIQSPQCHAKQKPQPGHDAIAIANAHADLGQVQLEPADILSRRGIGRAIEKRSKPFAAVNVASLRARRELPRVHVFDHAMPQRSDGARAHEKPLSWMRLTTPRSSRQGALRAIDAVRPRLSRLSRRDLVLCPEAAHSRFRPGSSD